MKAILIDPVAKSVTEVTCDEDRKSIYSLLSDSHDGIEIDTFTVVDIDDSNSIYYIDADPRYFLAGRGLVFGHDYNGDNIDTTLTIEQVKAMVTFRRLSVSSFGPLPDGRVLATHRPKLTTRVGLPLGADATIGHQPAPIRKPTIRQVRSVSDNLNFMGPWLAGGMLLIGILKSRGGVAFGPWESISIVLAIGAVGIPIEAIARRWGRMAVVGLILGLTMLT